MHINHFREWLVSQSFRVVEHAPHVPPKAHWYAYRPCLHAMRDCDCNHKPPAFFVEPAEIVMANGDVWRSCDAAVRGECGGVWYDLRAYSMAFETAVANLEAIEKGLANAWNQLEGSKK